MRDGRELVRRTKPFTTENRVRSWWYLLSTLVLFAGAIGVGLSPLPWFLRLPVSLLAALLNIRLFTIYHDYEHGAILGKSFIARAILRIYGLLVLAPPSIWKETHDHHHRNNSRRLGLHTIGSYPVLTIKDWHAASRGERTFYRISRHPLTMLLGYLTVFMWGFCLLPLLSNPRRHLDAALALGIHFGLIATLAIFRPDALLFAMLLPVVASSALGSYLFFAQHNFPDAKLRPEKDWDYVFAALRSSSYIRMNRVLCWFTGNIGYHHIHHLNARIPFYRLPESMAALEELQSPGTTSLRPRDVIRCLRLKLWDPNQDRFVSFAEARAARSRRVEELAATADSAA